MDEKSNKGPRIHRNCQYYLSYGNRHFCRFIWRSEIGNDPMDLSLGCIPDCPDFSPCRWRKEGDVILRSDGSVEEMT